MATPMASISDDVPMSDDLPYEEDVEAELEVDELDPSDDEQPAPAPTATGPSAPSISTSSAAPPSASTAGRSGSTSKPGVRVPGSTLFPASKIENLLQANGIHASGSNLGMSKEGQFMLSIATEEFIKMLVKFAWDEAQHAKSNLIRYEDMAIVPLAYQPEMAFLQDIIPRAMNIEYAMEFRERRLKELEEEDPALGGYIPPPYMNNTPFYGGAASSSTVSKSSKPKKEKASTNGKAQANGHSASASTAKPKKGSGSAKSSRSASVSSKAESASQRRSGRNGATATSASAKPSPLVNGHTNEELDNEEETVDSEMMDVTGVN
ncbi:hypothetical protein CC1G_02926 [Coprinopsis cinerea okayama7|uniref:Transcription factor CBF/NF-Y/archaeal histone domain-containing protein n=1 Tax=Coprinopsis cinerea (strain Okayama-7 / 130 / ATCC MYA-4618 / FGSC 9003) TaxID=240176 RepID=A8NRR8_COPC7|nr:hypothetical protein CC1G_02926 [Coprinopsis cinerea okayama7\|eukprot:XP_001835838.1 hypothetical protein CC1G_02926 [Coprinopsis cinerea okayama7\